MCAEGWVRAEAGDEADKVKAQEIIHTMYNKDSLNMAI